MGGRIENSLRNIKITFIIYFLNIFIQFLGRSVFLMFLSVNYLGINGLFTNILSMLNLAELGIGSAMSFALYKPCADKNIKLIGQIMFLYKKLYRYIGVTIIFLGLIVMPFLPQLIKEMPNDLGNIYIYFLISVANTASSYFFAYKRTLLICYQKQYISTIANFLKNLCICITQIVVLYISKNYYIYLLIQVLFTIVENIGISKITDFLYPYLNEIKESPDRQTVNSIKHNVMAMSLHKIGGVIVNGTDNLIITKFVSLTATGLYSNYAIIITAITSLISQMFFALTASVGNLLAEKDGSQSYYVFKRMYFLNFSIYLYAGTCLTILLNDFIQVWLGAKYQFSIEVVIFIIFSFFSNGMRRTVLTFKDASGLFWNDRFKPILEAICNLILSIPLTIYWGIIGTFVGTIITNIFVSGAIEAWVLFKYGFKIPVYKYFLLQGKYYINYIILLFVGMLLTNWICFSPLVTLIVKALLLVFYLTIMLVVIYYRTDEFKFYFNLTKKCLKIC